MAVSKCLIKGGKKGANKKVVDPFSKKDCYDMKAPATLNIRNMGKHESRELKEAKSRWQPQGLCFSLFLNIYFYLFGCAGS